MSIKRVAMLALAGGLLVGCAAVTPQERALQRGQAAVSSSINAGVKAAEAPEVLVIRARYNPCRCRAPEFELQLQGSWRRYLLNGDEELLETLKTSALELEGGELRFLRLEGEFRSPRRYENGTHYPVFRVTHFSVEEHQHQD